MRSSNDFNDHQDAAGEDSPQAVQQFGESIRRAAADVTAQVLTTLFGRIFSPRIKLLDIKQVSEATGLGRSTILEMVKQGTFPKPQRNLGKNMWRESALIAWADRNDPNQE